MHIMSMQGLEPWAGRGHPCSPASGCSMHLLLAAAGRLLLVLALVLTGPGLSARAMAGTHGHPAHGATASAVPMAAAVGAAEAVSPSGCHDMALQDTLASASTLAHAHAAHGDPGVSGALDAPVAADSCCDPGMGCDCDCAQLSAPAATARAAVIPARFRDAPASSAVEGRIARPRARLNRPPIA